MNYDPPDSSNESRLNDRRAKEKALIDRALEGDEVAYSEIISLYKGKIAATVYSILGKDYVEEISHEVFIRAFNSIKRYRSDSSFYTYLVKITVNLCRDEIRRKKIRRVFNFTEIFGRSENNSSESSRFSAGQEQIKSDVTSDPARVYDTSETIEIVREEMQNLTSVLREAVTLREIDELSYNEIAKLLKVSVGTAKTRVFRARQVLRSKLSERLNYEE
ncbi:MAG TPA: RNA polymerase sigma factor [Candidatus Acidoferrales bacterium]|nr:RNA polymerase sigma factor [Candidatus Acidoferrales bacterium]